MRGRNEVTHKFNLDGTSLLVNDVFYTIQGEGPDAGRPAIFVRLSKCNLRCWFCDTEFESGAERTIPALVFAIVKIALAKDCRLVVITGGEPLLQNIVPFVASLNKHSIAVSVETAGTVYQDNLEQHFAADRSINNNLIVCSPKTPRLNGAIAPLIGAYKYIIRTRELSDVDGLPVASTQARGRTDYGAVCRPPSHFPRERVFVQPCDEGDADRTQANMLAARDISLIHGYRLSLQMHKLVGVP